MTEIKLNILIFTHILNILNRNIKQRVPKTQVYLILQAKTNCISMLIAITNRLNLILNLRNYDSKANKKILFENCIMKTFNT